MLSSCTVPPNSKEPKLRSSNQEASPSTDKNTVVVLVQWHTWEGVPTDISDGVDIPRYSFVTTDEFSMGVTKISSRIGVS